MTALITRLSSRLAAVACALIAAMPAAEALPEIQAFRTEAGTRVLFVEAPEIPIVDVRFVFRAGAARDGKLAGVARLTNRLLEEGAGDLDASAFSRRLAATGAQFDSGSERDMAWVGMRSLTEPRYFEPAMDLLASVLASPRFDAAAVAQQKTRAQVAVQRRRERPSALADEAFYRVLYGEHPYATPPGGTPESLAAIDRDDIVAFHRKHYVLENAVVTLIGDLSRDEAAALAERLSAGMRHGARAPALPQVPARSAPLLEHVPNDSLQTHVRLGQPGVRRGDPDYFALLVGNHVLGGGGLVSKLFEEVREKRGLSYSVYSNFHPMAVEGPFTAALQTGREQTDEALSVLTDTIERFVTEGPSAAELEAAKQNLIGGFPLRVASNRKVLEYLAMIGAYELPLDYLETFRDQVAEVTVADVVDAFRRRVHPERFATVVVGAPPADGTAPTDGGERS